MRVLLYDNHENLIAIKTAKGITGTIDQEINIFNQLQLDIAKTTKNVADLEKTMYVGIPYRRNKYRLFKVETIKLTSNPISIVAIDSAQDDLSIQKIIQERRFVDRPLSEALKAVFEGTTWSYKQFAKDEISNTSFYRISAKEALDKVEKAWGVEIEFYYKTQGNKIIEKYCEVHDFIGINTNLRLVQGVNTTKVDYKQSLEELYTGALGRGAGLENTTDTGEATGGYSRSIEFDEIEWSKAKGDPVDKPLGQSYVEIPEATAKYGWLDDKGVRHPRLAKFEFSDEKDVNNLLKITYEKLKQQSEKQVLIETDVAKIGQKVQLGDTVNVVVYEPYKLTYQARVIKLEEDLGDSKMSKVTVGFSNVVRQAEREKETEQNTQNKIDDVKNGLDQNSKDLEEQKKDTDYKFTEVDKNATKQEQKAQEAIRKVEEDTSKAIEEARDELKKITESNTSASPLQFYGSNGQIVKGIPDVAYIRSADGNFVLNSQGFNFGGRLLGGNGKLVADEIYGKTITGYDINGAHIVGGSIIGATITGNTYIRSNNGSSSAVISADEGFSYSSGGQTVAIGQGMITINGNPLTSGDIYKLHNLK